jgi:hypothetical protein
VALPAASPEGSQVAALPELPAGLPVALPEASQVAALPGLPVVLLAASPVVELPVWPVALQVA